jgi:DNA-binding CsgD family transcriptional regulator
MRVAVMSMSRTRADVLNCLSAGFHGFIDKHQSDEGLLAAISDLLSGRIYVPQWLAEDHDRKPEVQLSINIGQEKLKLTRRQAEVLPLLALGMSNKEIARKLGIAEGTCKIHTAALLRTLGARNRTEAAFLAQKIIGSSERAASLLNYKRFVVGKLDGTSVWSRQKTRLELASIAKAPAPGSAEVCSESTGDDG